MGPMRSSGDFNGWNFNPKNAPEKPWDWSFMMSFLAVLERFFLFLGASVFFLNFRGLVVGVYYSHTVDTVALTTISSLL